MQPKVRISRKKASNKSCLELNFIQKNTRAHMYISPGSGARGLERLAHSKYCYVGKRKIHSIWGSTLPKIRITWKKVSNKSCLKLKFVKKSPRALTSLSPQSGAREFE